MEQKGGAPGSPWRLLVQRPGKTGEELWSSVGGALGLAPAQLAAGYYLVSVTTVTSLS